MMAWSIASSTSVSPFVNIAWVRFNVASDFVADSRSETCGMSSSVRLSNLCREPFVNLRMMVRRRLISDSSASSERSEKSLFSARRK